MTPFNYTFVIFDSSKDIWLEEAHILELGFSKPLQQDEIDSRVATMQADHPNCDTVMVVDNTNNVVIKKPRLKLTTFLDVMRFLEQSA